MPTRHRPSAQLSLAARGQRGGYRAAAGRPAKRAEDRRGHRARPDLPGRFPIHVTLKVVPGLDNLRRGHCFAVLRASFARGKDRFGFRLAHFTVQSNHLHLICEAEDKCSLSRGMQGLAIRMALGLNRRLQRKGRVFAERYHARALRSPTEVRSALVYVYQNARRHAGRGITDRDWVDGCTSAPWFTGWRTPIRDMRLIPRGDAPVVPPKVWLLTEGWKRWGLIGAWEVPAPARPRGAPPGQESA